jgi:hypothetical protein
VFANLRKFLSPQIIKKIGSANRKSRKVPHMREVRKSNKFVLADLRFEEFICGLPTFALGCHLVSSIIHRDHRFPLFCGRFIPCPVRCLRKQFTQFSVRDLGCRGSGSKLVSNCRFIQFLSSINILRPAF